MKNGEQWRVPEASSVFSVVARSGIRLRFWHPFWVLPFFLCVAMMMCVLTVIDPCHLPPCVQRKSRFLSFSFFCVCVCVCVSHSFEDRHRHVLLMSLTLPPHTSVVLFFVVVVAGMQLSLPPPPPSRMAESARQLKDLLAEKESELHRCVCVCVQLFCCVPLAPSCSFLVRACMRESFFVVVVAVVVVCLCEEPCPVLLVCMWCGTPCLCLVCLHTLSFALVFVCVPEWVRDSPSRTRCC